jgi:hypothetical protein
VWSVSRCYNQDRWSNEFSSVTVQVTKVPLQHKIRKIGMICFAKSGLTEGLCAVQMEEFSITCCICDTYT